MPNNELLIKPFMSMDDVLHLQINRPPANTLKFSLSEGIYQALKTFNGDSQQKVAVISATINPKGIFCGGWDLKAFSEGDGYNEDGSINLGNGGMGGIPEFFDLYKPVIAMVDGKCAGGGFEMVLGCDLIVATPETQFFLPEVQLGYLPDAAGIQYLHRRLPYHIATDMILTGRRLTAEEAKQFGLVREVVEQENICQYVQELAQQIANASPLAVKAFKQYRRHFAYQPPETAFAAIHRANKQQTLTTDNLGYYQQLINSEEFNQAADSYVKQREQQRKQQCEQQPEQQRNS